MFCIKETHLNYAILWVFPIFHLGTNGANFAFGDWRIFLYTKSNLPPAILFSKEITDTIADGAKSKYEAIPFIHPPLGNRRCNAFIAAVQPTKIQPIRNFITPKNCSFKWRFESRKIPKIFSWDSRFLQSRSFYFYRGAWFGWEIVPKGFIPDLRDRKSDWGCAVRTGASRW